MSYKPIYIWRVPIKSEKCTTTRNLIEAKRFKLASRLPKLQRTTQPDQAVVQTDRGLIFGFGDRFYIPSSLRKDFMLRLNSTNMSADMMFKTIKLIRYREGLKNNLSQLVNNCTSCQDWARSNTRQPPKEVPEDIVLKGPISPHDMTSCHGQKKDSILWWANLIFFEWCAELEKFYTQTVVDILTSWFNQEFWLPRVLRADSGSQCRAPLNNFLVKIGIIR